MINLKLITILGGIILFLSFMLAASLASRSRIMDERDQAVEFSTSQSDSLKRTTTKLGQESVRSKVLDQSNRNLIKLSEDTRISWIKQFSAIHKRMNNLEQLSSTSANFSTEFKSNLSDTVIHVLDLTHFSKDSSTIQILRKFDNKDPWIRVRGTIFPDSIDIKASGVVKLQSVVYWERNRWPKIRIGKKEIGPRIGSKVWYKETTSPNPYITITEDELIKVGRRRKLKK